MMKTLHKIIFLLTMLITFSAGTAFAQNSFYLNPETAIEPGQSGTFEFMLDNAMEFYGFQAEITLPQGIEIEKNDKGNLDISLTSRADDTYRIITNLIGTTLHIGVFSSSSDPVPFSGTNGALLNINVKASEAFRGANAKIEKIKFIKAGDQDEPLNSSTSYINILPNYINIIIDGDPDNTSIIFDAEGQTSSLSVKPFPKNAIIKSLTWESKDTSVASLSEEEGNEIVTAVGNGTTTIKVTTDQDKEAECTVVVGIRVDDITLDKNEIYLYVGKGEQLIPTIEPSDAINKEVKWESEYDETATVDQDGYVTAVAIGETTITATALGGNKKKATCLVHVIPTPAEQVIVTPPAAKLMVGESIDLAAQVIPTDTTYPTVSWTSSDTTIATVDPITGVVTAHALGETTITATCGDAEGTCIITVVPTPAKSITLNKEKEELKAGETSELIATVYPEDTTDKTVTWTSSNDEIATVDQNGLVTALAVGETIITARCGDAKATCVITVIPTPVESITLDKTTAEMKTGETLKLTETVLPENATDKTVTWSSSDEAIATVDGNGNVKAFAIGDVIITVKSVSNPSLTASCSVTVVPTPVEILTLDRDQAEMIVGDALTLIATVKPDDATDKTVTWTSSDETIATVDENGKVTAISKGEVTITASCASLTATCKVTVLPITVASITLNKYTLEMKVGESESLIATVAPENAEDTSVTWASNNEGVVTVDNNGNITALAIGTATITANCGSVYASCLVTVVPTPAERILIDPSEATLEIGQKLPISATVLPETTTNPTIVWTSSDPSIASVDNNGEVTANADGVAVISAICGEVTAECKITVLRPAPNLIELTPNGGEIKVKETLSLTAKVYPATAIFTSIEWSSSNPDIATVDNAGIVTGISLGETTITATCEGVTASCTVKVIPTPVERVTLTNTTLLMRVGKTSDLIPIVLPTDATDPTVVWSSDNEAIATVDVNGIVTAHAIGNATITATSVSNPNAKGTCYVTVEAANDIIAVGQLIISDKSLSMTEGDLYTLTAKILPEDATDKTLTWKSSDTSIATVNANGEVTAIKEGVATIYVSSSNGLTEECAVTVKPLFVAPTGITLSNTELLMFEGDVSDLIAIVRPDNASDKTVVWSTSDPAVATVDENGFVTGIKQGNCIIKATTYNGFEATCNVTVVPVIVAVEDITLNKYELEMEINETFTLIATITPENATDQKVTWKTLDNTIADVSEYGVVTAIAAGTTTIYASTSNGLTAECKVTVRPGEVAVESITISQSELLMREGFTSELFAIIRPDEATDKTVFWTTSDPSIATVDEKGLVTAILQGNAIITASSANGKTAICNVTVVPFAIPVEEISIYKTEIEIEVEETFQLTATVTPEDATDKTITWKSLDKAIATVSNNGLVTGISAGVTTVYASSSNGKTIECKVTVRPKEVEPESISLTNTELLMIEGETAELLAIVRPDNTTDKSVTWTSSDESIATVDNNGVVTAIHQGFAVITATTVNGKIATCAVTVTIIPVESITLNKNQLEMEVEDTETLIATIKPDNATDKTVTWRSSNRQVATVSENGLVTAVGLGTATIYASSSNGLTAECEVTVKPGIIPVTGISLSNSELLMREGYNTELIAIVRPDNATDKTVTWSTDNAAVATFGANEDKAIIYANAVGTAIITVTSNFDPSIKAQCVVTVQKEEEIIAVESITLNKTAIEMTEGDIEDLIATILPEDATDKSVTWKSSDKEIATVSDTGKVTAIKEGIATIYASSSNGLTAECVVTVKPAYVEVKSVSLTNTELLMREGHTADLIAIVRPDNATDKTITWTSSDETIATVDQNGIVTAILVGKTTITASSHNNIKAYCYVTVVPDVKPVEGISVNPTSLEMEVEDTYKLTATITPDDATDKTVTWRSSDRAIATVAEDGTVTAVGAGTATIYASSSNGLTAECAVTVNPAYEEVISISLTNTELLMIEGDSTDLIAIIRPDNATDKSVTWESSDEEIVTVDQNGNVDAIKQGNAIVTATASNGVKAECYVTVLPRIIAVESITINPTEIDLNVGDEYTLSAAVTPDDATDKSITWKSSNRAIATVDENGVVTAVAEGTISVYASSSNGLTAECIVNVHPGIIEVESITLTNTELLMREGYTADLIAIVGPENATDKSVTWASTDEAIATVDQNGIVTAIHQGQTVVSATTNNGLQAFCYVTVVPVVTAVEDLIISRTELTMIEGDDYLLEAYVTPDDATDKTFTWKSTDKEVATVSENGLVSAIKVGTTTILASSSNGLTKECLVTVEPRIVEVEDITLDPEELTLSEGETATLTATILPEDATDKSITWISSDPNIATVEEGIVTGVKEGSAVITVTSANGLTATCHVTVYARPLTPKQLLRKGNGTSCTFVVMMDLSDAELAELGYRFVYGYNDANGQSHVIEETPLRYTHTSSEIYNDPTNDFWAFSLLENKDGVLLNSNLRHLDGSEEVCFDAAKYGYPTKGDASKVASLRSDDLISITPTGVMVAPNGNQDLHVAIYNMTGIQVYAKSYKGFSRENDVIEFRKFTPDTYILIVSCGGRVTSKKIVIR